jgi:xanthine dehydrogenase YagS FAD-binding subunit
MVPRFSYLRAVSLDEAVQNLQREGAMIYAGGTDLLGCLRDRVLDVSTVVSIAGISALRGIRETTDGGLSIGALTTISDIARNPIVMAKYRALAMAAGEVASPQLRNQGTIGGNHCQKPRCWYYRGDFDCLRKSGDLCYAVDGESHYHCILGGDNCYIVHPSDTAPALVALGANAVIVGPEGRRTVPLQDFHVTPAVDYTAETVLATGEIVTEIILPPPPPGLKSAYRKVRARRSWDFALAGMASAISFEGDQVSHCRVVLSGAAPVPWRSREVESAVTGRRLGRAVAAAAAEAAVAKAEPMNHNRYKIPLLRSVVEQELLSIAG